MKRIKTEVGVEKAFALVDPLTVFSLQSRADWLNLGIGLGGNSTKASDIGVTGVQIRTFKDSQLGGAASAHIALFQNVFLGFYFGADIVPIDLRLGSRVFNPLMAASSANLMINWGGKVRHSIGFGPVVMKDLSNDPALKGDDSGISIIGKDRFSNGVFLAAHGYFANFSFQLLDFSILTLIVGYEF